MNLRILGCSGGIARGLGTTSMLVNDSVLIDAGTGVSQLTLEELARIRRVFLTHSHLDHIACLPFLAEAIFSNSNHQLKIHALPETISSLQKHIFNWDIWPDFGVLPDSQNPSLELCPMNYESPLVFDGVEFEMLEVRHVVPTAGVYVKSNTGAFFFSGDTARNDMMWEALNLRERLDLLIVETTYTNDRDVLAEMAKHYTPELLAEDLKKLRHQPKIAISHLKPGKEEKIFGQCKQAMPDRDLIRLSVGDTFKL